VIRTLLLLVAPAFGDHAAPSPLRADTLRGTVVEARDGLTLLPAGIPLTDPSAALRRVAGLEVALRGATGADGRFRVEGFVVRAARGVPAEDGELAREGDRYLLLIADGRRIPLGTPPAELRDRVGWRVWMAGPPEHPAAFGLVGQVRRPEE
jgi:hypothetical protein